MAHPDAAVQRTQHLCLHRLRVTLVALLNCPHVKPDDKGEPRRQTAALAYLPSDILGLIHHEEAEVTQTLVGCQQLILVTALVPVRCVPTDAALLLHQTLASAVDVRQPRHLLVKSLLYRSDNEVEQLLVTLPEYYCHNISFIFLIKSSFAPFSPKMMPHFSGFSPKALRPYFAMMLAA